MVLLERFCRRWWESEQLAQYFFGGEQEDAAAEENDVQDINFGVASSPLSLFCTEHDMRGQKKRDADKVDGNFLSSPKSERGRVKIVIQFFPVHREKHGGTVSALDSQTQQHAMPPPLISPPMLLGRESQKSPPFTPPPSILVQEQYQKCHFPVSIRRFPPAEHDNK